MRSVEYAVIAAAGRGKRLGAGKPKCLVEVAGVPIINYQLYLLRHVPHLRMVIGYCEDDVIAYVKQLRRDIVFVRNPNYRHTTTLQSIALGVRGLSSNVLCLDGDMIIEEKSFTSFIKGCMGGDPLVGVADEISEDPVYANVEIGNDNHLLTTFSCNDKFSFEWANIAYVPTSWITFEPVNFYERLMRYLPLTAKIVNRIEIDTPADLAHAETLLESHPEYCHFIEIPDNNNRGLQ